MPLAPISAEFEPAPWSGRRAARARVRIEAGLQRDGMGRAICRVLDLTRHGARLIAYIEITPGARLWLTLRGHPPRVATVRWSDGYEAGCEFERPLDPDTYRALGGDTA
jgi:PilZ domain